MKFEDENVVDEALVRLRKVQGQLAGIIRMIEEGRECREVMQQLTAASKALDRVGFKLLASQLEFCLRDEAAARESGYTLEEFERMFMKLA
ncbi:transcriptional regulator [Rubrobacter taiwanensis]|uniref:Transcriptional regulator n=1 Tax=Rubrobacter taiwanensis TaxID=185139 RepID=A0A4R1BHU9_9ACTN|nr:metal-sensitive transcriptional regulator [Rubrobacter taiwanensis]TCJ16855.1 transcriptional regulator [Rubrobacter taiwanensis]